jgi:hypothetical protein
MDSFSLDEVGKDVPLSTPPSASAPVNLNFDP